MKTETLPPGKVWLRIAQAHWADPLDASYSRATGGRWNPPGSHAALYLSDDAVTARFNFRLFVQGQGYEPEDLNDESGPVLVGATLPRNQTVADAHTPEGLGALGLPNSYPHDSQGRRISWRRCQPIGAAAKAAGLRGIYCRSAEVPDRAGRELAWFPATSRSKAKEAWRRLFTEWYW